MVTSLLGQSVTITPANQHAIFKFEIFQIKYQNTSCWSRFKLNRVMVTIAATSAKEMLELYTAYQCHVQFSLMSYRISDYTTLET
jgi:hypothetical protein